MKASSFSTSGETRPPGVADHHCVTELQLEEGRRVGAGIEASDHVDAVCGMDADPLAGLAGGEVLVACNQRVDVGPGRFSLTKFLLLLR